MKVHTFYGEVPGISSFDSLKLICAWREVWKSAGFDPVVLNMHQAEKHPYFKEFEAGIDKLPTQNAFLYEKFCYCRWLALAQVGGGLLSDYDVFPRAPAPLAGAEDWLHDQTDKLILMQSNCCCPCLSYATVAVAERVCREFVTREFKMHEINGNPHLSDQYCLSQMVEGGVDWIQQRDLTMLYSEEGWEKRPFVHFANRIASTLGKIPRWKYISEVLGV